MNTLAAPRHARPGVAFFAYIRNPAPLECRIRGREGTAYPVVKGKPSRVWFDRQVYFNLRMGVEARNSRLCGRKIGGESKDKEQCDHRVHTFSHFPNDMEPLTFRNRARTAALSEPRTQRGC